MKKNLVFTILVSLLSVTLVAATVFLLIDVRNVWYLALRKPDFQPAPSVVIAAWGFVYACSAVALALCVWKTCYAKDIIEKKSRGLLALWLVNGFLTIAWCAVFFRLHQPSLSMIVLVLLLADVIILMRRAWPVSRVQSFALLPYLIWVIFSTTINYAIVLLN